MALEPWCMRPWEIARLTDWQIENLYRKPQIARLEEMRAQQSIGGSGGYAGSDDVRIPSGIGGTREDAAAGIKEVIARGEAPSRMQMVALFCAFGSSVEDANKQYDAQLAEWNAMQAQKGKS